MSTWAAERRFCYHNGTPICLSICGPTEERRTKEVGADMGWAWPDWASFGIPLTLLYEISLSSFPFYPHLEIPAYLLYYLWQNALLTQSAQHIAAGFATSINSFNIRQGIHIRSTLFSHFFPCIFFFWNFSVQCRVTRANEKQRLLRRNQQTLRQTLSAVTCRSRNSRGLLNRCWWDGMVILTLWILAPFHPRGNGFT